MIAIIKEALDQFHSLCWAYVGILLATMGGATQWETVAFAIALTCAVRFTAREIARTS